MATGGKKPNASLRDRVGAREMEKRAGKKTDAPLGGRVCGREVEGKAGKLPTRRRMGMGEDEETGYSTIWSEKG